MADGHGVGFYARSVTIAEADSVAEGAIDTPCILRVLQGDYHIAGMRLSSAFFDVRVDEWFFRYDFPPVLAGRGN